MQVQRFDPFSVLSRMDREFDDLVRRQLSGTRERPPAMSGFVPAVEVVRDGQDVVVRVELPGVDVERDVTIEVDRGKLVLSGERRDRHEEHAEGLLVRELRYGQFRREFALPPGISPEQVEATYDAGLLDVRVRGVVAPEPTVVKVPITTGRREPRGEAIEGETVERRDVEARDGAASSQSSQA
jgi:HSP20 family protein